VRGAKSSHGRGHRFETCHAHEGNPQLRVPTARQAVDQAQQLIAVRELELATKILRQL
jgi:hypothetical protein